jgi:hypothetical protein
MDTNKDRNKDSVEKRGRERRRTTVKEKVVCIEDFFYYVLL